MTSSPFAFGDPPDPSDGDGDGGVVDASDAYSFVSAEDLQNHMSGIGLEVDQAVAVQTILDGLQRDLERYCHRRFSRQWRTETAIVDDLGRVWVEATPVAEVDRDATSAGVELNGGALSAPYAYGGHAGITRVVVRYLGGLDPEGDDLHDVRLAILRAATPEAAVRHDDVLDPNELSARRTQNVDKRVGGFTEAELARFDRLRRRVVL